ncbi:MAG: ribosome maturation factor RimP [Oscillospiraceae bacterium]|nr:ribosome maturation factor RimP [Oscillospiraceae bacterium]
MGSNKGGSTVRVAERLIMPVIEERGLDLWDTRFEKEGSRWYLRYFIDKSGGVNISDCEFVSRAVEKLLDESDPIQQSYTLEVSSPGIERELVRDWHFEKYLGSKVCVRLIRPVEGIRDFYGELLSKSGDEIKILLPGDVEMSLQRAEAANIKLAADYETGGQYE